MAEPSRSVCHHDDCPPFGCMKPAEILTDALDNGRLIAAQTVDTCEFCGKDAELRPYGPKGERVCFPCAMEDEETAKRQFAKRLGS
jgi:hypothetical protein